MKKVGKGSPMKKVNLSFGEQPARMRESIREEMEIWEKAITQKYGIIMPKKKSTK